MFKGLRDFIMRGNVVDLAVAVVIGAAFGAVVNSLVADVFTPLIGAMGGSPDFSAIKVGPVLIGKFINTVISFIIVSSVIYFMVVVPMQHIQAKLLKKKEEDNSGPPVPPEDIRLLREILETLKNK